MLLWRRHKVSWFRSYYWQYLYWSIVREDHKSTRQTEDIVIIPIEIKLDKQHRVYRTQKVMNLLFVFVICRLIFKTFKPDKYNILKRVFQWFVTTRTYKLNSLVRAIDLTCCLFHYTLSMVIVVNNLVLADLIMVNLTWWRLAWRR